MYYKRTLEPRLRGLAGMYSCVLVTGIRQAGKTELVRHSFPGHEWVLLDRAGIVSEARSDPALFLRNHPPPCIFGEVQRVPELFLELKDFIDQNNPGRGEIILTGSQLLQMMKEASESLAGRVGILELSGMTPSELRADEQTPNSLAEWLQSPPVGRRFPWPLPPADMVFRGGFPRMVLAEYSPDDATVAQRLSDYIQTFLTRDLRDLAEISDLGRFERFLRFVANTSARLLNVEALARESGIPQGTIHDWLSVLEAAFVIRRIPGYSRQVTKREVKRPKLILCDSGLLLHLLGFRASDLARESPSFGAAFETLCAHALFALLSREGIRPPVYHWRSGERDEVDFVVELTSDMTIPIECKLTGQPSAADAQGIQRFLQIHGVKGPGVVISAQEDCFWLTPNVLHIPLSAL